MKVFIDNQVNWFIEKKNSITYKNISYIKYVAHAWCIQLEPKSWNDDQYYFTSNFMTLQKKNN